MKPHTFAQMVNEVRDLARQYGQVEQFRDRVADLLGKYIPVEHNSKGVQEQTEAPVVVVPDATFTLDLDEFGKGLVCITINSKNRGVGYELCGTMGDGHFSRRTFDITPYLAHCLNTIGVRAIPADRVLGEGMAALRRFAERCAQRDHQPDEHIGSAKCVACEAEDALRANQGGVAT